MANWGANALRAARAASKCVYLMHSRRVRVLKRTTVDCPEMTETTTAAAGSVGLVLLLTTQAANVRAANVWTARAVASRVSYLLLLLLMLRLAWAPAPGEMYDLTAAAAQMVGGKVISTAHVAECRAAQVRTTRAASMWLHPSLVPGLMMSLGIAPERAEMDGVSAASAELDGLVLRSTNEAAERGAARARPARAASK